MSTNNEIWKKELGVEVAEGLNGGDKIILPADVLEELLELYDHNLPTPLTFKVSTHENSFLHCGVREFSSQDGTIIVPPWIHEFFNGNDTTINKLTLESVQLPKGKWAKFVPLEDDFLLVKDLRVMFESSLRANFTALTQGQILHTRYASKDYKFRVDELKPEIAVNIIDTDLEIDIETPINFLQGTSNSKNIAKKLKIQEVKVDIVNSFKLGKGESMQYQFLWPRTTSFKVVLKAFGTTGPNAFLIPGVTEASIDSHIWASFGSQNEKTITVKKNDPAYRAPYHYSLTVTSNSELTFNLIIEEYNEPDAIQGPAPIKEDEVLCTTCNRIIPKSSFTLHTNFCARNNKVCAICNKVFKSNEINQHWHCELCLMDGNSGDNDIHYGFFHTINHCECGSKVEGKHGLARHKILDCPNRLIECRFCHDLVPYNKKSSDPADWEFDLTEHESYCGNRTITCSKCNRHVSLKKVGLHAKYHEFVKQSQPLPFQKCSNSNCIKEQTGDTNEMRLCQACFYPIWSPNYDPENKALRKRVALRYHNQLVKGCQNQWCKNQYCATATKEPLNPNVAAAKLIPLLKIPLLKGQECHFCVDQSTTFKMELVNKLKHESNGLYPVEWYIRSLTMNQADFKECLKWLRVNAPTTRS